MKLNLSWADKLALVEKYQLSESEACTAFNITRNELNCAKNLEVKGIFSKNELLNTEIYSDFFDKLRSGELDPNQRVLKPKSSKPSKITLAFENIKATPTKVADIIEEYGVSLAVLRQSKRFDKSNIGGQIHIRKDKATQELMVWRAN